MDAPEWIWARVDDLLFVETDRPMPDIGVTEYVRTDLYAALKAENDRLMDLHEERVLMHHDAEAHADRLAAENERLRAAIDEFGSSRTRDLIGSRSPTGFSADILQDALQHLARAALSGGKDGE